MYINIETKEVISREQLQTLFPETSFPPEGGIENSAIAWTGYAVLENDPYPILSVLESFSAGGIREEEDGRFFQTWIIVPPTEAQWVNYNTNKLNGFLRQANAQITAIQGRIDMINDAIDIGEDEPGWAEELPSRKAQLVLWKKYRIDLNKVSLQIGWASNVIWPIIPQTYTDEMSSATNAVVNLS